MADTARSVKRTFNERRIEHRQKCKIMPCSNVHWALSTGVVLGDPPCVVCVHEGKLRSVYDK